ncbi:MAG TPA: hypothetical protein VMS12_09570 [Thermoanaerobaculia bacterium]|nr:hypothetical protein [Thermoanaerobaculia bacterium]
MTDDRPPRVLIADDDDVMIIGVAELLRRRGIEVDTVNQLKDAYFSGYDIVIFDPLIEETGLSAARSFVTWALAQNPPPALIVVSEFIDSIDALGTPPGPRAVLHAKPIRVSALAESVETMLSELAAEELEEETAS